MSSWRGLLIFTSVFREKAPTPKPEEPVNDGGDYGDDDGGNDDDGNDGDDYGDEEEEPEPVEIEVEAGFDLNDLLNKIPFMYPRKEPCTWRYVGEQRFSFG